MVWDFTEEQLDEFAKGFEQEMLKRHEQNIEFIKSEQNLVMEKVYEYLKENKKIDNEDMSYFPEKYNFSHEGFIALVENLRTFSYYMGLDSIEENNCFENNIHFFQYRDLKIILRQMYGQGTSTQMYVATDDEWKTPCCFDYNEFSDGILSILQMDDRTDEEVEIEKELDLKLEIRKSKRNLLELKEKMEELLIFADNKEEKKISEELSFIIENLRRIEHTFESLTKKSGIK